MPGDGVSLPGDGVVAPEGKFGVRAVGLGLPEGRFGAGLGLPGAGSGVSDDDVAVPAD